MALAGRMAGLHHRKRNAVAGDFINSRAVPAIGMEVKPPVGLKFKPIGRRIPQTIETIGVQLTLPLPFRTSQGKISVQA